MGKRGQIKRCHCHESDETEPSQVIPGMGIDKLISAGLILLLVTAIAGCDSSAGFPEGTWLEITDEDALLDIENDDWMVVRHGNHGWEVWDVNGEYAAVLREGTLRASVDDSFVTIEHEAATGRLARRSGEVFRIYEPAPSCAGVRLGYYTCETDFRWPSEYDSQRVCRFGPNCSIYCEGASYDYRGMYYTNGDSIISVFGMEYRGHIKGDTLVIEGLTLKPITDDSAQVIRRRW